MGKANLRTSLDTFADNVKAEIPTTLQFDGEKVYLVSGVKLLAWTVDQDKVRVVTDLTDDTVYRLVGDDIDQVAEEMGEKLTEAEVAHVQKGIDAGFGNCWHDIVESAIQDVVMSRRRES